MRTKLLLIPLVPAIAIGIGLVAHALGDDPGAAAPVSVANEAPPPPAPPPCGPHCGTDA